jgi:hypothetical protein
MTQGRSLRILGFNPFTDQKSSKAMSKPMNPICRILRRRFCRTKWGVNSAVGAAEVVTSDFIGVCAVVCAAECVSVFFGVGVLVGACAIDGVGVIFRVCATDCVGATAGVRVSFGIAVAVSGIRIGRIIKLVLRVSAVCRGWTSDPQSPS